jgi:hypothetical protein
MFRNPMTPQTRCYITSREGPQTIPSCMMEAKVEAKLEAKRFARRSITLLGNPASRSLKRGTNFLLHQRWIRWSGRGVAGRRGAVVEAGSGGYV